MGARPKLKTMVLTNNGYPGENLVIYSPSIFRLVFNICHTSYHKKKTKRNVELISDGQVQGQSETTAL